MAYNSCPLLPLFLNDVSSQIRLITFHYFHSLVVVDLFVVALVAAFVA